MGVTGLWDVVRPASRTAPLTQLSLDKLLAEPGDPHYNDQRALRIGVDLPAWLFHAGVTPNKSKNAKLRTIFFRTLKLLQHGVSLVFVLDGPGKPGQKRGKKITSYRHPDAIACEAMLRSLGIPVVIAPGEAEAELAVLCDNGLIDYVLTDDSDALIFGAPRILRNNSVTLSANRMKGTSAKDAEMYEYFVLDDVHHRKDIGVTQEGLILIALCSGGDYDAGGIPRCGITIAHGLARTNLGPDLIDAYKTMSASEFEAWVPGWVQDLCTELRTNASGKLGRRQPALAGNVPQSFPNRKYIDYYVNPAVSTAATRWRGFASEPNGGKTNALKIAQTVDRFFDTLYAQRLPQTLISSFWRGEIIEQDRRRRAGNKRSAVGASTGVTLPIELSSYIGSASAQNASAYGADLPSVKILGITRMREDASTGKEPEYRVKYDVSAWNEVVRNAQQPLAPHASSSRSSTSGSDLDDESALSEASQSSMSTPRKKSEIDPDAPQVCWIPARLVRDSMSTHVVEYERMEREKEIRRTPKKKRAAADTKQKTIDGFFAAAKPSRPVEKSPSKPQRAPRMRNVTPTPSRPSAAPIEILDSSDEEVSRLVAPKRNSSSSNTQLQRDSKISHANASRIVELDSTPVRSSVTESIDLTGSDDDTPKKVVSAMSVPSSSQSATSEGSLAPFERDALAQDLRDIVAKIGSPEGDRSFARNAKSRVQELQKCLSQNQRVADKLSTDAADDVVFALLRLRGRDTACVSPQVIDECLEGLPHALRQPSYLRLLQTRVRQAFQKNAHPQVNLSTGRKMPRPAGGEKGMLDAQVQQVWKTPEHWGIINVVQGCIEMMAPTELDNSSTLMYITPPALTIIDDYDPPIRTQGLDILSQLVDRLSLRTLKKTGAFELFMTALQATISSSPGFPLPVLPDALSLLFRMLEKATPEGSAERDKYIEEAIEHGIINGWIFAPSGQEGIANLAAIAEGVQMICNKIGLGIARYLKSIVPNLVQPLEIPSTSVNSPLQLANLSALEQVIITVKTSGLIAKYRGKILTGVCKVWLSQADSLDEDLSEDTRNAIRDAAKKLLQTLVDSVPEMLERHREIETLLDDDEDGGLTPLLHAVMT